MRPHPQISSFLRRKPIFFGFLEIEFTKLGTDPKFSEKDLERMKDLIVRNPDQDLRAAVNDIDNFLEDPDLTILVELMSVDLKNNCLNWHVFSAVMNEDTTMSDIAIAAESIQTLPKYPPLHYQIKLVSRPCVDEFG